MAILHIEDVDDDLLTKLQDSAARQQSSVEKEVGRLLHRSLLIESKPEINGVPYTPGLQEPEATQRFLALAGTWEDNRTAEEIIEDIYRNRRSRPMGYPRRRCSYLIPISVFIS